MNAAATLSDFEQRIVANVRDHGCQVNFVFDPDGKEPDFSYSIGFPETVNQPEIIVFGLDQEVMHFMANEVLRLCRDAGLILDDWTRISGLLEGFDCIARVIPPENILVEHFNSALWFHRYRTGETLDRAVQIIWPGAVDGLFPWDDGAADLVRDSQPALYERRNS